MRRYFWAIISLAVASQIQGNLPSGVSLWGAKPDLVLVVLIAYSLAADLEFGATLGFIAGLIQGSVVGQAIGSFIVTRTLTGFLAGLTTTRVFSENPMVPMLSAMWLTLVAEVLFLLANPTTGLVLTARKLAGECILNALLTLILYLAMGHLENRRKNRLVNARI